MVRCLYYISNWECTELFGGYMSKVVFLGGTCGANQWRKGFIERLVARGIPSERLFDPVVEHWDAAAQQREDAMKADPAVTILYYLGDPGEEGNRLSYYSLLEATMGLYDAPARTAVVFDSTGMPPRITKSNNKACADLKKRFPQAPIFDSLTDAEGWVAHQVA